MSNPTGTRGEPEPFPLTPGQAIAVAAIISTHPNQLPHWLAWVERLRTWAAGQMASEDDS